MQIKPYEEPMRHYQSIKFEDFDYPMSDTFRGYSYEYCGVPDPAKSDAEPREEIVTTPEPSNKEAWRVAQEARGLAIAAMDKAKELYSKKKDTYTIK